MDHDATRVLARTGSQTLKLSEDSSGLQFELCDTRHDRGPRCSRTWPNVATWAACSSGFSFPRAATSWNGNRRELRTMDLREISVVSSVASLRRHRGGRAFTDAAIEPRAAYSWRPADDVDSMNYRTYTQPWRRFERARSREPSWAALRGGMDLGGPSSARASRKTCRRCWPAWARLPAQWPACRPKSTEPKPTAGRIDETHPVARLIANGPNAHQTWADFIEWAMASVLLPRERTSGDSSRMAAAPSPA